MHPSNHRHWQLLNAQFQFGSLLEQGLVIVVRRAGTHFAQIMASAKRLASSGDDDNAHADVLCQLVEFEL